MRQPTMPTGMVENGSVILQAWNAERQAAKAAGSLPVARSGDEWRPGRPGTMRMPGTGAMARFMAASDDRLVEDMMSSFGLTSGNAEVRNSLRQIRSKSRRLAKDNEYVKHFLHLLRNNVIGPRGMTLQMKVRKQRKGELDKDANGTIEVAYAAHSKPGEFTACGKMSRATFERALITGIARDGEVIIEELVGREFGRFGITRRMIDPDLLDDQLNVGAGQSFPGAGRLAAGNTIRMGVEVTAYMRPVAYWFHSAHPGDDLGQVQPARHRRVAADRILHWFLAEDQRPDVTRGVPWIYAGLRRMAMLSGYEEAALVNARQGASKMGFYKQPPSELGGPIDGRAVADNGDDDDEKDPAADLYQESEPGVFGVLPPGWDFTTYDPAYPNDQMGGFVKTMLRAFSASVGITYNTIASDLENVNLSSMRHGAMQDRDTYEAIQAAFVEHISEPMFARWLELGLTLGQVGRLPMDAFDRLNLPRFIARPWRSPDPQKDVSAGAQEVALGTNSRTRLCAEKGVDFEEVLDELAEEEAMAKARGVTLNTQAATAHKNPPAKTPKGDAGADDDEADDKPEGGADAASSE